MGTFMKTPRHATSKFSFVLAVLAGGILCFVMTSVMAAPSSAAAADAPAGPPVLVELFTSEGCSSCPPADALLGKLDASQVVPGARAIVLSEHVDYWDHDGWKDAYSSAAFTERQVAYEQRLGVKGPYTPQMVIDGAAQLNGSEAFDVGRAIQTAAAHVKVPVRISGVSVADGKTLRVHLAVDALPADFKTRKADVLVALALDHVETHVGNGENKGRDIRHVAVAESINKVGTVEKGKPFDRDVTVKIKAGSDPGNLRVVAFVQGGDEGEVVGAAESGAK
jgi:hypothetical protein